VKVIPSLTQEGWVTNSKDKLAFLLSYYILSDAAQSISFQNNIINLPETYYKNINNPDQMSFDVKNDLDKLLSRYFVNVDIVTEIKEIDNKKFAILIYASVIDDDNIKTELTKITEINSSGLKNIIDVNNYGSGLSYLNSL